MINQFDEVNNFLRITNKIIVFGEDTHNTLGIIRSIGTCGKSIFFVDCVDGDRSFVDYSKFIIKTYKVSSVKEGLDTVISVFGNEKEKPIIICTSDPIMSIIDLNYNILKDRFIVPNAGWQGAINELMDKSYMRRIAEKVGFKLPFSITISLPHFEETQLTRVPFPCFVKPSNSLDGNKKDMRICNNLTELKLHLKELVGRTHKVEIQEYIEKDYEFSILGCSLSSGKCLIPIFWIKKTEDPECPGNTAFGKCIKSLPDFDKEIVIRFFKETGYNGIFSVEFLAKGNNYYFLEANFRNDGNGYASTIGGVNLPAIWISSILETNIKYNEVIDEDFYSVVEPTEMSWLNHNKKRIGKTIKHLRKAKCKMIYDKEDLKPFYMWIIKVIHKKIQKL